MLSQWNKASSNLQCAFFFRKLSPAKRSYYIGNKRVPSSIYCEHRPKKPRIPENCKTVVSTSSLFYPFSFCYPIAQVPVILRQMLSLSHFNALEQREGPPPSILPSSVFACPIHWTLDERIAQATLQEPAPEGCPPGQTYIPMSLGKDLLESIHSSLGSGHPGVSQTLFISCNWYWWPQDHPEEVWLIRSCPVCAMAKSPHHLPSGKLLPIPIPRRSWSHLGDCRASLPTRIQKLWDPLEFLMKTLCLTEFISRVWRAFFRLLGVTVSLSSDYHPQSNGQTEHKIQ